MVNHAAVKHKMTASYRFSFSKWNQVGHWILGENVCGEKATPSDDRLLDSRRKTNIRPPKKYPVSCCGRLQGRCGDALFLPTWKYVIHLIVYAARGPNLLLYKVWWLREASQIRQTFILKCEKSKAQLSRIPKKATRAETKNRTLFLRNGGEPVP